MYIMTAETKQKQSRSGTREAMHLATMSLRSINILYKSSTLLYTSE